MNLEDALTPQNGHLVFTSKVLYKAILATFGSDYLAWRLLVTASSFLQWLIYAYARPRIGAWPALAPSLVLLVFGSDILHVLVGNGITVLLALCCGLGGLWAIQRGDRAGDIAACALLCLGSGDLHRRLGVRGRRSRRPVESEKEWPRIWVAAVPLAVLRRLVDLVAELLERLRRPVGRLKRPAHSQLGIPVSSPRPSAL